MFVQRFWEYRVVFESSTVMKQLPVLCFSTSDSLAALKLSIPCPCSWTTASLSLLCVLHPWVENKSANLSLKSFSTFYTWLKVRGMASFQIRLYWNPMVCASLCQRKTFCFMGPWINHTCCLLILSTVMHFFFWVCQSTVVPVTDWVDRWDENMAASIFSQFWDTGTPIFSGASSIFPSPTLLSFPFLPFPSLPSAVILFKDSYLYPSSQVSQVKTASQQASQPASQPERHTATEDVLLPFLLVYGNRDTRDIKP